jgi:protein arginine N-methyltransferase 1
MKYSLFDYARMLADTRRIEAYYSALRAAVTKDSVVLDVGSGLGLFALEAARLGAREVIAVDPNPAVLMVKELAERNALSVSVHQCRVEELILERKATIVVFDLRGALPLFGQSLSVLQDVVSRLAEPGAIFLPQREHINFTLASCADLYDEKVTPWGSTQFLLDLTAVRNQCAQGFHREQFREEYRASETVTWAELNYAVLQSPHVRGEVECPVNESARVDGFFLTTEVFFPGGVTYSCLLPAEVCVSGSAFFPFQEPLAAEGGDVVKVAVTAQQVGESYHWSWQTSQWRAGECVQRFEQSTLAQLGPSVKVLAIQAAKGS